MGLSAHWPGGDALNAAAAETISLLALLGVLAWAVSRPRGWPEAVAAVPAAVILIAAGATAWPAFTVIVVALTLPGSAAGPDGRRLGRRPARCGRGPARAGLRQARHSWFRTGRGDGLGSGGSA